MRKRLFGIYVMTRTTDRNFDDLGGSQNGCPLCFSSNYYIKRKTMKKLKELFNTLHSRWKAKTPLIFKRIIKISIGVSTASIAIQTAFTEYGIEPPAWWMQTLPYLIGAGVGAGAVAKLTQQYDNDGNPIKPDTKDKE